MPTSYVVYYNNNLYHEQRCCSIRGPRVAINKHNQSKRSNILVVTEALLVAYMAYITQFILVQIGVSETVSIEKLVVNVGMLTVCILVCSLSVHTCVCLLWDANKHCSLWQTAMDDLLP